MDLEWERETKNEKTTEDVAVMAASGKAGRSAGRGGRPYLLHDI
jgi:hypothetical protein